MFQISQSYFTQIRHTLSKLDLALGCIDEALIWLDEKGNIEWSNSIFDQLTGKLRIQTLGAAIDEIINFPNITAFTLIARVAMSGQTEIINFKKEKKNISLEVFARESFTEENKKFFLVIFRDVTDKQAILDALLKKDHILTGLNKFLESIVRYMSNMLIVTTANLQIKLVNPATVQNLDYQNEIELIEKPLTHILHDTHFIETSLMSFEQLIASTNIINQETVYITQKGQQIPVLFSATAVRDLQGHIESIVCVAQDISKQKQVEQEIRFLASHDSMTTLANRSEFAKILTRELDSSKQQNSILGVLFIDLDQFKHINDTLGHGAGDKVLIYVAQQLKAVTRKEDIVARLTSDYFIGRMGGDEFVILLTGLKNPHDAGICAKRILARFEKPYHIDNNELYISMSIGIAVSSDTTVSSEELVKNADIAMYLAKEKGHNNIEFFSEASSETYRRHIELENGLHAALDQKQFYLVYQSQHNLKHKNLRGIEVLLRWKHASLGNISPQVFIPVAEKSGLIVQIGNWVLKEACQTFVQWQQAGEIPKDVCLSINISTYQLIKAEFIKTLRVIINETKIDPRCLEFEITETALMTQLEGSEQVLNQIKKMGVYISIDDFGTGYSSLARIKELPINTLKIDKTFIQKILTSKNDAIIVESIIALAKALGLEIIAEGAESFEQVNYLLRMGCEVMQGFYCMKPTTSDKFIEQIKNISL